MVETNDQIKKLRSFGLTMGVALLAIALAVYLRRGELIAQCYLLSGLFVVVGIVAPSALRTVYGLWMCLAHLLAWINTRLILIALFYFVVTPIGLIMRLFGADLLEVKTTKKCCSYWHKKEQQAFRPADLERQF